VTLSFHVGPDFCFAFSICKVKSRTACLVFQIGVCALLEEEFNHHNTVIHAGMHEAGFVVLSLLVIEDVMRGVLVDEVARLVVTVR